VTNIRPHFLSTIKSCPFTTVKRASASLHSSSQHVNLTVGDLLTPSPFPSSQITPASTHPYLNPQLARAEGMLQLKSYRETGRLLNLARKRAVELTYFERLFYMESVE
jgi:hypothetical protein